MDKSPRRAQTSKQSHKRQVDIKLPQAAEDHPRQPPPTRPTDQKGAAAPPATPRSGCPPATNGAQRTLALVEGIYFH